MTMDAAFTLKPLVPGVSPDLYREEDFLAISRIVESEAGIVLPPAKAMLVYSRIAPLVRKSGCQTFAGYIERVEQDAAIRNRTIAALTTNHTFFYRESHHFEHFASVVRPTLLRTAEKNGRARLWSAGCSSGEETWSLVLTLLGADRPSGLRIGGKDIRVLATDIADHAIARAEAATYPAADFKALPEALVRNWTNAAGADAIVADEARRLVRFRLLNLLKDWPMRHRFDVIFCRNVMIYFDAATKERLVKRLAEQLKPGGYLYIGHSERATGPAAALLTSVGPTIYQRNAQ